MTDFGGVEGNQSIGQQMQQEKREPVTDEVRVAMPGRTSGRGCPVGRAAPAVGALGRGLSGLGRDRRRTGDGVDPASENPLPPLLARELHLAEELEAEDLPPVPDVDRTPEPDEGPPGAQWNEVLARWERWDEASGAWVEVD